MKKIDWARHVNMSRFLDAWTVWSNISVMEGDLIEN
jgi:hypothetical protein